MGFTLGDKYTLDDVCSIYHLLAWLGSRAIMRRQFTRLFLHFVGKKTQHNKKGLQDWVSYFRFAVTYLMEEPSNSLINRPGGIKPRLMKKKFIIILTTVLVLTSGILLAFNAKSRISSTCSEAGEECCQKKNTVPAGMLWENLSHQFSTTSGF